VNQSSLTEETPATPGWVDRRVREIFAPLNAEEAGNAYADCLAGIRGDVDTDAGHDRCRRAAIEALESSGVDTDTLDRTLQALEAEISNAT
jgi:uncharacterized protein YbjT (DUF2867 family)